MSEAEWDAITRVRFIFECPHDGEHLLTRFIVSDGAIFNDVEGQGITWREEWVGDFDARAVSGTRDGDDQHWRTVMVCPRCPEGCGVCQKKRSEGFVLALRSEVMAEVFDASMKELLKTGSLFTQRIANINGYVRDFRQAHKRSRDLLE